MSTLGAKDYIRSTLVGLTYKEHPDGFNTNNIPSTIFNKAFHVEFTGSSSIAHDNMCLRTDVNFTARVFLKGFRNPALKIDEAMVAGDEIIKAIVSMPQRTETNGILNSHFVSMDIRPLDTNDNAIIIELGFRIQVMIQTI
jgi:hypothetical protein